MRRIGHVLARAPFLAWFLVVFLRELVRANLRVAWEVLTPGFSMQAGIVRVPTHCRSEWEMLLLANTITMTPGTLSLEVDTDNWELYVHTLYVPDRAAFVAGIHELERVMLRGVR